MASQFVCRHAIPQVTGPLGILSNLCKVFEITTTMLVIEVKKKHSNESTSATECGLVPIVP